MSSVYDAIMWLYGPQQQANQQQQRPRHIGRDHNLAVVMYQNLQENATPADYAIAFAIIAQFVVLIVILSIWSYSKINKRVRSWFGKKNNTATAEKNEEKIIDAILKEGGMMSKQ